MENVRDACEISAVALLFFAVVQGWIPVWSIALLFAVIIASSIRNKETRQTLGLRPRGVPKAPLICFLFAAVAIMVIGAAAGSLHAPPQPAKIFEALAVYGAWAFAQELILNGYFMNRLAALFRKRTLAAFVGGAIFSMMHAPNRFLMCITFAGGSFIGYFFLDQNNGKRTRNIYFFAFCHAALALLILWALPSSWHHNLTIGMYFRQ